MKPFYTEILYTLRHYNMGNGLNFITCKQGFIKIILIDILEYNIIVVYFSWAGKLFQS